MSNRKIAAESFWHTVRLLWHMTHQRSRARVERQRQILQQKKGSSHDPVGYLGTVIVFLGMAFVHVMFGWTLHNAVRIAMRAEIERDGRKLVVSERFLRKLNDEEKKAGLPSGGRQNTKEKYKNLDVSAEAGQRERQWGSSQERHEALIWEMIASRGRDGFMSEHELSRPLQKLGKAGGPLALAASNLVCLWWFLMLTFQGEGLELDFQRRRHPMWEWLFTHPIRPEAAFFAEMVSPLAANPAYLTAPLFWIISLAQVHALPESIMAGLLIGLPCAVACGCVSKALEIGAMLRLSTRSRGAVLGLMSWLGYALLVVALLMLGYPSMLNALLSGVQPFTTWLAFPGVQLLLGIGTDRDGSIIKALLSGWLGCGVLIAASVWCSAATTKQGIEGGFGRLPAAPRMLAADSRWRLGKDPLHRKELLWLWRDRGAIVQAVLIPLTLGAVQVFNLRYLVEQAGTAWHYLAGLAVICGTYFLIVLGPRSLISEGPALWITLTWPRGLESLLKAKAQLWWMLATVIVCSVLFFTVFRFPADAWKVLLVGVGWWAFGRSLAEKAVTLVTVPSSSGEPEKVARWRQWAAMLGTFSFGSGVLSQNWHLATVGVVFSWLTAAAMWQNFRERLPFLYDPWSEKLPPPPTLMHSMIAIAAMTEGIALVRILLLGFRVKNIWAAQSIAYAAAACITCYVMLGWLYEQGITNWHTFCWDSEDASRPTWSAPISYGIAAAGALCIAVLAFAYLWLLSCFPITAEQIAQDTKHLQQHPQYKMWLAIAAIGVAPFAEEYLFRGLLYRALDREWRGWKALLGNAVFFAIYHPPVSWLPVATIGLFNALLFKITGRLGPCIAAHMIYNAMVVLMN